MTKTLHHLNELLRRSVHEVPDRTAVVFKDRSWSYRELGRRVDRCAENLSLLGVKSGDAMGLVMRNCPEFIVAFFALCRLGARAVPVNFLEKPDRIAYIFSDAGVTGCFTSTEFLEPVRSAVRTVPSFRHLFVRDSEDPGLSLSRLWEDPVPPALSVDGVHPDDIAMLLYTAGTTGLPKGVMLTHKNFCANVASCCAAVHLTRRDTFLCLLPMFHSFCWTVCVLIPLSLGSTIVVMETITPFEPVLKAVWRHKVTIIVAIPTLFATLAQRVRGWRAFLMRFLNPVRLAISGAAALSIQVSEKFEDMFGILLLEGYGLTEASPVVSLNPLRGKRKLGTVGVALPGVRIQIVDERETVLGPGAVGEICVSGDNVMKGYYNHPEETRASFTRDGWLKTGDLGRLDGEGYLTIVDRKKDLIIEKGLNIYPQEIEQTLLSHPSVQEVAVVGIKNIMGDEVVAAFIVGKEGAPEDRPEIHRFCREKLAPYKRPRHIEFVKELPKNALGKVMKKELQKVNILHVR
ncbi:MAG TPA: long-chain fatty acid--CoA ligase [Elusimicrobiota bacterium]|nr:long-chain fatty acid--CoA ligase [Elusimicrobiota bacterium]